MQGRQAIWGDVLTSRGYQLGDIRGICTSLSLL